MAGLPTKCWELFSSGKSSFPPASATESPSPTVKRRCFPPWWLWRGGWVHRRRDLGGIVFIDLRDRAGIVQVAFGPGAPEDVRRVAGVLTTETVVEVEGQVTARPANMKNAELATGDVEVQGTKLAVVGPAVTAAIPVARGKGEELPAEELRLQHRQLDLP